MPLNNLMKKNGGTIPTKVLAAVVFIGLLTYVFTIIILWTTFLPQMESAAKETENLIGGSTGEPDSIIQGEYISEIKLVYTLSLMCFGLFDTIFSVMLWKGRVPKNLEKMVEVLARAYVGVRSFSLFLVVILSIMTLVGSNSRFPMSILYLIVPIFSVISLIFILYFNRKVFGENVEDEYLFKIPDESSL